MLATVDRATLEPFITTRVAKGALIHTDEYDIYGRLPHSGYGRKTVCHADGEYARDEDDDGSYEVHVNTIEGFWSLLRSWLRPHRGISQEKLRCIWPHRRPNNQRAAMTSVAKFPNPERLPSYHSGSRDAPIVKRKTIRLRADGRVRTNEMC